MKKQPLIIITGPTAVGKTALSVELAGAIGGEIISADSMQVYRHMDIGSAKATKEEMAGVPHHLIDVLEPDEQFDVFTFQRMAKDALQNIYDNGHIPIIAGGTGFYIQALLYDIDFTDKEDDGSVRQELERLGEEHGNEYLHEMLRAADPEAAAVIHANNRKRVIRAIEYHRLTGAKISAHNQEERAKESPYQFFYYVVSTERSVLYERIEKRVDEMIADGLVAEVEKLKAMGCSRGMVSMMGLGYKEILDYLDGSCTLLEAVYTLKRDTRHFAKRQLTWFKRERDVRWLHLPDFDSDRQRVLEYIRNDIAEITKNGDTDNASDKTI